MGSLELILYEAKNLISADLNGKSDPYVSVKVTSGATAKSKTIKKTLNPQWNGERLQLDINNAHEALEIRVMDWDVVGSDDFLGSATIRLNEVPLVQRVEKWYKLEGVPRGEIRFALHVSLVPLTPISSMPFIASRNSPVFFSFDGGHPLQFAMGPVLVFHGLSAEHQYNVGIVVVVEGKHGRKPALTIAPSPVKGRDGEKVLVTLVKKMKPFRVWRYSFGIQQSPADQEVHYTLQKQDGGKFEHSFWVPGIKTTPRLVYNSCNGFSNPEEKIKQITTPVNALWERLNQVQQQEKYHLILQGGDQVYADPLWKVHPNLVKFTKSSHAQQLTFEWTPEMKQAVQSYFFHLYTKHWAQPEIQSVLAEIPMINMWDDHDIFDGWGSWPAELQASPVYQGIYRQARKHFSAFQLGCSLKEKHPATLLGSHGAFHHVYHLGGVAIACLDNRSERTIHQIMTPESYKCFEGWLDSLKDRGDIHHLFVMSGVPLVYNDLSFLESLLEMLPGQQSIEDDLRDHWSAKAHRHERIKFINVLSSFASRAKARVTVLSGDVHLGALGVLVDDRSEYNKHKSNATVINNLVSSPIGNVIPPPVARNFLKSNAKNIETLASDLKSQVVYIPDARHKLYLAARNYLTLRFDNNNGLHAFWHCEDEPELYNLFIRPYSETAREDVPLRKGAKADSSGPGSLSVNSFLKLGLTSLTG